MASKWEHLTHFNKINTYTGDSDNKGKCTSFQTSVGLIRCPLPHQALHRRASSYQIRQSRLSPAA